MAVLGSTGKVTLFSVFAKIVAALTLSGFDPTFVVLHLLCVARSEFRIFLFDDSSRRQSPRITSLTELSQSACDYNPSHKYASRMTQQARYNTPRKFSAYRSYRTTSLRKFCSQANSLSTFQRRWYRRNRRRSCVLFFLLLRCGAISSAP